MCNGVLLALVIILNLASNSATAATLSCDLNLLHCYYSCRCEGREGGGGRKSIQSITDGLPIAVAAGRCGRRSSPAFCNGPADRPRRARGTRKWARERQQRAVAGRSVATAGPFRVAGAMHFDFIALRSLPLSPSRQRGETPVTVMMIVTRIKLHFSE